jgi:hypothetical protein
MMTADARVGALWRWAIAALGGRTIARNRAAVRHQRAPEGSDARLSPFWEQIAKALTG